MHESIRTDTTPDVPQTPAIRHADLVVVDGHCDTVLDLVGESYTDKGKPARDFLERSERGHIDLPRLVESGVTAQFFAMFTSDPFVPDATGHTHRLLDELYKVFARTDRIFPARSAGDVERAKAEGRIAAFLTIEGGEAIGESLDTLRAFHARGVRLMGPTWSRRNALGRGVGVEGTDGLSDFGRAVVAEMERLGMIVDASHLSDEALDDLLAIAGRPVVASHSNSRALCDHRRNLTDAQAERIAATGGLVAITFAGAFVDKDPAAVNVERILDHIERMVRVAGAEHVGIGTDFDGFSMSYGTVMGDCTGLPALTAGLAARGFDTGTIAGIMGRNWLRVIREVVG